jgi:hypothetical protein
VGQPGAKCAAFKRPSRPSRGQAASGYPGTSRDRRNHIFRYPDMSTDILRYTEIGNLISCDRPTYTEIDILWDISRYHVISFWQKDILGYPEMSFRPKRHLKTSRLVV